MSNVDSLLESLQASIGIVRERDALRTQQKELVGALEEALEYFEDREDVIDGSYGEPAPNKEMQLAQELRAALKLVRP